MGKRRFWRQGRPRAYRQGPALPLRILRNVLRALLVLALLAGFAIEAWGGRYGIPTWGRLYALLGVPTNAPENTLLQQSEASVTFFDVGQGDAVLIAQGGEYCLIDAGPTGSAAELARMLRETGVERLKLLVLTHPHADHSGGMRTVLQELTVDCLLLPPAPAGQAESWVLDDLRRCAGEEGTQVAMAEAGAAYAVGQGTLTVLQAGFAAPDADIDENGAENDASLCLRYVAGDFSFLDTGDAETAAEDALVQTCGGELRAVLFKAGHHGSSTSNSEALLHAASPQAVGISCGIDNDYGHPHGSVLRRLSALGIDYARTDTDGTLTYTWAEGQLSLHTAGKELAPAA